MSEQSRSLAWLVGLVALATLLAVLVLGNSPDQDRVEALGQVIKCPVCQGESIGDSPAQMARDMMAVVAERVEEGRSDQEIIEELLQSYSGAVLLDPPAEGATLLLWLAPVFALLVGVGVILWQRQRQSEQAEATSPGRTSAITLVGLALAFVAIVIVAGTFIQDRSGAAVGAADIEAQDLSEVSNETLEAVIAANLDNPQINGMRLALGERYFEAGNYGAAFPHYLAVAETDDPPGADSVLALTRLGWMAWDGNGEADAALSLFDEALEIDARAPTTRYLKAQVLWCGAGQPEPALDLLLELADDENLDEGSLTQIRADVDDIAAGSACA